MATIDYKQKIKDYMNSSEVDTLYKSMLNNLFPELKESEDERIRKEIISALKYANCKGVYDKHLAWLEKQGQQKVSEYDVVKTIKERIIEHFDNHLIIDKCFSIGGLKDDILKIINEVKFAKQGEQKQKIQPKFKIGDIIRFKGNKTLKGEAETHKIVSYDNELYVFADGTTDLFCEQDLYELVEQNPTDKIKPKFKVGQTIKKEGFNLGFPIVKIENGFYYNDMGDYSPFTDQDNWELVEQKPAEWSEDDEEIHRKCICAMRASACGFPEEEKFVEQVDNWLKSLKDRVQPKQEWNEEDEPQKELAETYLAVFDKKFPILPTLKGKQLADYKNFLNKCQQILGLKYWGIRPLQTKLFEKLSLLWAAWGAEHLKGLGQTDGDTDNEKQEWSEEDEKMLNDTIQFIETGWTDNGKSHLIPWLKSLRSQNRWKPSDEQMDALRYVTNFDYGGHKATLVSLYEQLKKLKG